MNMLGEILYGRIDRRPYALRVSIMEMIVGYSSLFVPKLLESSYGSLDSAPQLLKNVFGIAMLIIFFFELVLCVKRMRDIGLPGWVGALGLLATSLLLGSLGKTIYVVLLMVVPTGYMARFGKK